MKRFILAGAMAAAAMLMLVATASAATIIDNTTPGYYNDSLSTTLDNHANGFPLANVASGDPLWDPAPEPTFTAAGQAILGNFLTDPTNLDPAYWTLQVPDNPWTVNTETAIVYKLHSTFGLADVQVSLGVDNGFYMWLDGEYVRGALAPGSGWLGEYQFSLGDLTPGDHYLQIIREDHGVAAIWFMDVLVAADTAHDFDGFFDPVDNEKINLVQPGRAIPMKFSLGGDHGLDIFASGYPLSHQVQCPGGPTVDADAGTETVTAGGSTLQYDASTDTYTYVWKTQKDWSGQCREFDLLLAGDNPYFVHSATFQFK